MELTRLEVALAELVSEQGVNAKAQTLPLTMADLTHNVLLGEHSIYFFFILFLQ
jgi:hypothetical protein